jgi:hypothetical protein
MFKFSIRSELTRKYYERRIRTFFNFIDFCHDKNMEERCNSFAETMKSDSNWGLNNIIRFLQFQKERTQKNEITPATMINFVKALKLFCEMSDIPIPWKKLTRGLPRARETSNDRAPTIEEISKLVEYPDRRIKPIIFTMISSGIRLGSWDYLKWKHVIPISNDLNEVVAAKIIVYAGDIEEYFAFVTPEAYHSLKDWMDFRASYGEIISGESWIMRDLWKTTNITYGAKLGLATNPKKLKSSGVKRIIERALWEQGLRHPLKNGEKRHEWKAAHGFRKFYKTRTEQVMRPINVEITMGHNIGLSASYYKPTVSEVLDDYLKAIDLLSISYDNNKLEKQIAELKTKNKDNEQIIKLKLEEKDEQIELLMKNQEKYDLLIQSFIESGQLKPTNGLKIDSLRKVKINTANKIKMN